MNKKIILCAFSIMFFITEMNAQYFEKDTVFKNEHIIESKKLQDFDVHMQITNPSDYFNYTWTRKVLTKPNDWTTAICDPFLCHDSATSTGKFFFFKKGESATFFSHFYFNDTSGGYAEVQVILENDTTHIKDTAVFSINVWNSLLSVKRINQLNFNIFPNPTNGAFNIQGKDIEAIHIFDMQGQEVYTEESESLSSENVLKIEAKKDLPKGIYLVRVKQAGNTTEKKVVITN